MGDMSERQIRRYDKLLFLICTAGDLRDRGMESNHGQCAIHHANGSIVTQALSVDNHSSACEDVSACMISRLLFAPDHWVGVQLPEDMAGCTCTGIKVHGYVYMYGCLDV